jgi:formylglycine-generating enzyme required for sulfatase activity
LFFYDLNLLQFNEASATMAKDTMKTKLHCLFIGLAIIAGLHQATAQVTNLGIAPVAGGQSLLYWPAGSPTNNNYILQSTTNLAAPNWTTEKYPVPVTASTVSNTTPAKFFRPIYTNPPAGMVLIPAGSFTMGDTLDGENNAIPMNVYVSAFFMDTNLVNLSIWQAVYTYATTFNGYSFDDAGAGKAANHPVQTVNWYDCVKWCNARSQVAGLTPVYYTDAGFTQVYKTGDVDAVYVNWSASGYRLPTEAEWEKAARGGLSGRRFPWGDLISESQANYYGYTGYSYDLGPNNYNSLGSIGGTSPATSPVGSFDVNGYGLYDMAGNVFEWCWDWYGTPYGQPSTINPTGVGSASGYRMLRGGNWDNYAGNSRCARRNLNVPSYASSGIGFRCVRGL